MNTPLFPLSSIVMPEGIMKLRLFERRYIDMVKNCFRTETGFVICLIRDGGESGAPSTPYPLGTLVSLVDFDQGDDGLLHITARGESPVRIIDWTTQDDGLLIGEVEKIEPPAPTPMESDFELLSQKLDLILRYVEPEISYPEKRLDDADWICHRLIELLPLAPSAKYELLQMDDNRERLETLASLQIEISER